MTAKIETLPATNASIIKGQPFSVVVTVSGETSFRANTEIDIVSSTGVHLIKKFPGVVVKTDFIQQMVFLADDTTSDYKISFAAKTASKPNGSVDYKPVDNPHLDPATCLLTGSSSYLYDPNPVSLSGAAPTPSNPFIQVSINPKIIGGGPISEYYDIQLRATAPVRIFRMDDSEILSYKTDLENQYYDYLIDKPSTEAVNLKIYATQGIDQFVGLETIFSKMEFNQKQTIFIATSPITTSADFAPPSIQETYQSSTLTRPDKPNYFHFMVPQNNNLSPGNFLIGFVTNDDENIYKKELIFSELEAAEDSYFKFKVDYNAMYDGLNFISYVTLDNTGNPVGSEPSYIDYKSGGNNGPDPDDPNRTLVAPEVYDQWGRYIGIHQAVNINSVGKKGIEVWLPVATHDPNKLAVGDSITIKAYISYSVDMRNPVRQLPIIAIYNYVLKQNDIDNGYYKHTIEADKLMDYDTAKGAYEGSISIEYSRLTQNQKSQLFTRGFDTYVPE
ncbi:hypothetical protein [Xenorhabdus doucetiae]|uniref:Uncharacterized protein n=1 Tax=Xenorhabdus doucetiae TaxID=351671 RepID=A0A068QRT5_9GAMM|nr:hypothetical protein [Xenorhabdus doucetiae]TYP17228.1 hypothetical protein LY16_00110 [Xenorhabdus doucetiae]CDG17331.1 conserved protein of unknown function [Xenorhabdus doucetiae]